MSSGKALDHPCRETCSGWKQGYEKGLAEKDKEIERLRAALEDAKLGFNTLYDKFICDDFIASGISQRMRRIEKALDGGEDGTK